MKILDWDGIIMILTDLTSKILKIRIIYVFSMIILEV